jgi:hypothetical protein
MKTSFRDDARAWLAEELAKRSAHVPASADAFKLACLFFNVLRRTILPAFRAVHMSSVLKAKLEAPTVDAAILTTVREIVRRSEAGKSLRPFQSTRVADIHQHDLLLNDWGIHHLHVGPMHGSRSLRRARSRKEPRRGFFTGRRNELLFAYAQSADLYLIDLLDHDAFADKSLVETMHREWPETLRRHVARGIRGAPLIDGRREDVPAATRKALRKRLNFLTTMDDGTVYFAPGGGSSTATISSEVVTAADRFLNGIDDVERWTHERDETFRAEIERAGLLAGELNLRLEINDEGRVILREHAYNAVFRTDLRLRTSGALVSDVEGVRAAA